MAGPRRAWPGADAVYGAPLDGIHVVPVPTGLAPLFADAHHRIRARPAGVHLGDGRVVGTDGSPLSGEAPPDRWVPPPDEAIEALEGAAAPVVLAGPGVVLDGAVPGLHALAAAGSLGVLNTWGAKGVFDWRSRHHLATVGLQAWDFERGGLGDADLIVATGVDEREARAGWRLAPVVEIHPWSLDPLADRWGRPRQDIAVPTLRADLGRVTQAGWAASEGPLPPTKVTQLYGLALGGGGLVAADPGTAGYWVARTVGTTAPGGVLVPADPGAEAFSIAAACVARLLAPGRAVLAVVDAVGDRHEEALEAAAALGVAVPVEVWDPDGPTLDAAAHVARLGELVAGGGRVAIRTDPRQLDEALEVAGPVVAWRP